MTKEKNTESHTYTVQLRFSGRQLDPSEISEQLNLKPSHTSDQLQNQLPTSKRRPFWAYNGHGEIGFQAEWVCLEDGLKFLIKSLHSKKADIIAVAQRFDGIWWCGHFQNSFDGGPILSPILLTELGSYGISLGIDNYFSDD